MNTEPKILSHEGQTVAFRSGLKTIKMKFNRPTLREGHNVTVRLGRDWLDRIGMTSEVKLDLVWSWKGSTIGIGYVVQTIYCQLSQIPIEWMLLNHDPKCRTVSGLISTLQRYYPSETINELTEVTAVLFVSPGVGLERVGDIDSRPAKF